MVRSNLYGSSRQQGYRFGGRNDVDDVREIERARIVEFGYQSRQWRCATGSGRWKARAFGLVAVPDFDSAGECSKTQINQSLFGPVTGPREFTIPPGQRPSPLPIDIDERVIAVLDQVAETHGRRNLRLIGAAMFGTLHVSADFETAIVLAKHEVDHAGDRVRAIDRRRTVAKDLYALHGGKWNHRQVDGEAQERIVSESATVQQDERVPLANAAKVGTRETRDRRLTNRLPVVAAIEVRRDVAHQFGGRRPSGALDFGTRDDLEWQQAVGVRALDVRAGHLDADRVAFAERFVLRTYVGAHHGHRGNAQAIRRDERSMLDGIDHQRASLDSGAPLNVGWNGRDNTNSVVAAPGRSTRVASLP